METQAIYDVKYFFNKFSAIPEERWTTYSQFRNGKSCAFGHCSGGELGAGHTSIEGRALAQLFVDGGITCFFPDGSLDYAVAPINNGDDKRYQQSTPKQRIIAALRDIAKKQGVTLEEPKTVNPEIKERVVYVTVDSAVRTLQKELRDN